VVETETGDKATDKMVAVLLEQPTLVVVVAEDAVVNSLAVQELSLLVTQALHKKRLVEL
jgi:hypothetical protein